MKPHLAWVESAGGPLILAPRSAAWAWKGSKSGTDDESRSDYERACAVSEEIGIISIHGQAALVLGDEPDRTCLICRSPTEVLIVRWRWADSEESLLSALDRTDVDQLASHYQGKLTVNPGEYLLFDSALPGDEIINAPSVELSGTRYTFDAANFQPNENTYALLHRLRAQE